MQVLKQRFAGELLRQMRVSASPRQGSFSNLTMEAGHIWQRRFYDFVVWNPKKRVEKLRYMHWNPVARGLVLAPGHWRWSSFRSYAHDEAGGCC